MKLSTMDNATLGIMVALMPWALGILGFGEPGPIEGSSRGCLAENRCGLRTQGFLV
ncbi:hypothetical protein BJX76DRAFT_341629 [Aspergillus varians]